MAFLGDFMISVAFSWVMSGSAKFFKVSKGSLTFWDCLSCF